MLVSFFFVFLLIIEMIKTFIIFFFLLNVIQWYLSQKQNYANKLGFCSAGHLYVVCVRACVHEHVSIV